MLQRYKNRRKIKRRINRLANKLKYGTYFINCDYYPCLVTKANIYSDKWLLVSDIDGINIIDGAGTSCSLLNCAPQAISREQAYSMREDIGKLSYLDYLNKHQYGNQLSEEDIAAAKNELLKKEGYFYLWDQRYQQLAEYLKNNKPPP